ncbi:MAG: HIT domain-containing protein [Candidatus Thermoplasmatota archaeon]|nr:HIT domain-containing protein [Candidatus Thermoplasmatota archaeon]
MSRFLCDAVGGKLLWQDDFCRVVHADEPDYPGFLRVILNAHVKEMTDLPAADQQALMRVVFAAEAALREGMAPDLVAQRPRSTRKGQAVVLKTLKP